MPDREKVLKALEHHKESAVCNGCPYAEDNDTPQGNCPVYDDAIALLREQEPVEPRKFISGTGEWYEECGSCRSPLTRYAKYCPECGKAVKWDV